MNPVALAVSNQYLASLQMLADCIERCPDTHWDAPVVKYPFWQVAYHTLCFVDYYLAPTSDSFVPRADMHPRGMDELREENPSRRFERAELLRYVEICRALIGTTLAAESDAALAAPCAFPRKSFSRLELHVYNIRHIQHHAGSLGASLRKAGGAPPWRSSGWSL